MITTRPIENVNVQYLNTLDTKIPIDFYSNNKEKEFTVNTIIEKKRFSWDSFVNGIEDLIQDRLS